MHWLTVLPLCLLYGFAVSAAAAPFSSSGLLSRSTPDNGLRASPQLLRRSDKLMAKASKEEKLTVPKTLEELFGTHLPVDNMAIFGGAGVITGFCFKKIGKALVWVGGGCAIGVNLLERNGYVKINWDKIQKDITRNKYLAKLDKNKDGKISSQEFASGMHPLFVEARDTVSKAVQNNVAGLGVAGTSFGSGFLAGMTLA